ncbi:MAG TPA: hypothetical protein VK116_00195 [Planctomycetota bacterium]|nr:hypothetical protein [Planctomycetota bacterium]
MSDSDHKDKSKKPLFCAVRAEKCECPNQYRDNAFDGVPWATITFPRVLHFKKAKKILKIEKKPEAHHLVCVGSVTKYICGDVRIAAIVRETKWCVNDKPNMLALPLWGHTVQHYCSFTPAADGIKAALKDSKEIDDAGAPDFQNWPQHDVDHNGKLSYKWEVDENLRDLANGIARRLKKKDHGLTPDNVKRALDAVAGKYRKLLTKRGKGTHDAWKAGEEQARDASKTDGEKWYLPFSMAAPANAEKRTFPGRFDSRKRAWIDRLANAMWSG